MASSAQLGPNARILCGLLCLWAGAATAVAPVISEIAVVDVTPSSVTLVWEVDQDEAVHSARIFADAAGIDEITSNFLVTSGPLIAGNPAAIGNAANAASLESLRLASQLKGLARVRIDGLNPGTTYYARAVSSADSDVAESPEADSIAFATAEENSFVAGSAQLRIVLEHAEPTGIIVLVSSETTEYGVSSVVGDGAPPNEAFINLNHLFDTPGSNWEPMGSTNVSITVREGLGVIQNPTFEVEFVDGFVVGATSLVSIEAAGSLLEVVRPAVLTYSEGGSIVIEWNDELPAESELALYYDTDDNGLNGIRIVDGIAAEPDGASDRHVWDTIGVPDGLYWVYAQITTGATGTASYAAAPVAIDRGLFDGDSDGLSDLWEQLFFGTLALSGADDSDLDGRDDRREFEQRTIPTEPDFLLSGARGLNLVAFPVAPEPSLSSFDVLSDFAGEAASIAKINGATQLVDEALWTDAGIEGMDFPIVPGEGYMVRFDSDYGVRYEGSRSEPGVDLSVGVNLAGFAALPPGYSAYSLLQALGGSTVVASVGRLNEQTQRFESAAFQGTIPVGEDFPVKVGESYFIHLFESVSDFRP